MKRVLLLLMAVFALAGCTKRIPSPAVKPGASDPVEAWGRVLQKHVDDQGRIDFVGVKNDIADLETYVAWAAKNGPKSTPEAFETREEKLAYYLNTYNAMCMWNVLKNQRKPKQIVRFFFWTKLVIDGEEISLYDLENKIIRPAFNEPRVHFVLNCMVRGCPRLPREPIRPETLERQLEDATVLFFSEEPRNVDVREAEKTVRFSSILKFYTKDFLVPNTDAKTLIEYANKYRERKIPEGFEVKWIPYDWTLNQMPRGSES